MIRAAFPRHGQCPDALQAGLSFAAIAMVLVMAYPALAEEPTDPPAADTAVQGSAPAALAAGDPAGTGEAGPPDSSSEGATGSASEASEEPPLGAHRTAMWAMVGLAGLGLVSGGVFGMTALGERDRYDNNPSNQAGDRAVARATAADVSFGVAGAAALTALILWLTEDDETDPTQPVPVARAAATPGGAVLIVDF